MEPVTLGLAVFGIVAPVGVWAVRTEGRINTLKAVSEEQKENIDARLERIENKLDAYFLSRGGNKS
jgi:hypothetical protein